MPSTGRHHTGGLPTSPPSPQGPSCAEPEGEVPRYSSRPLPPYRFVPGVTPHPRRHANGHSYGEPDPACPGPGPDQWQTHDAYLFGVDLYNCSFWWECHEVFEGFWRSIPRTEEGRFFQALIHVAAANLKLCMGCPESADRLSVAAWERFRTLPDQYMGLDVRPFEREMRAYVLGMRTAPAPIRLAMSGNKPRP